MIIYLDIIGFNLSANLNASNISLYDVASLSRVPSISTAVLNPVVSLSNLSGLIAIFLTKAYMIETLASVIRVRIQKNKVWDIF